MLQHAAPHLSAWLILAIWISCGTRRKPIQSAAQLSQLLNPLQRRRRRLTPRAGAELKRQEGGCVNWQLLLLAVPRQPRVPAESLPCKQML